MGSVGLRVPTKGLYDHHLRRNTWRDRLVKPFSAAFALMLVPSKMSERSVTVNNDLARFFRMAQVPAILSRRLSE